MYTYRVEGLLTDNTVVSSSQPQTWFAPTDSAQCLSCTSISANPNPMTGNQSTLTWNSANADSCTVSDGSSNISQLESGSISVSPSSATTYTLLCLGPEPSGGNNMCNLTESLTIDNTDLPLWLNRLDGNSNMSLDFIKVRPGQQFGLNWKTTEISSLITDSCRGFVYDINDQLINLTGWSNTTLSDNQDNTAMPFTISDKGNYTFEISCRKQVNSSFEDIVSNPVEVNVTQATLEER